jgi:hypothetical protein
MMHGNIEKYAVRIKNLLCHKLKTNERPENKVFGLEWKPRVTRLDQKIHADQVCYDKKSNARTVKVRNSGEKISPPLRQT